MMQRRLRSAIVATSFHGYQCKPRCSAVLPVSAVARKCLWQLLYIQYQPGLGFLRLEERQKGFGKCEIGEIIGGELGLDGVEIHGLRLGKV